MNEEIEIELQHIRLLGNVRIPEATHRLVIFAHGSGSSRLSPRNRYVATALNEQGIATCLFDLLTAEEDSLDLVTREYRFNIHLLAERLVGVTHWLSKEYQTHEFNMGYFGSSTGAAAALVASTHFNTIQAIVSRGGRPDLAGEFLEKVPAATLLIVGGEDRDVIDLNKQAFSHLHSEKEMVIVPNATHLFEEPGTLDEVINLSAEWFKVYL